MAISSATGLSDAQHSVQLRRAVFASTVGTIIEAYDFLLYVQVAPLVFAKLESGGRSGHKAQSLLPDAIGIGQSGL